MIVKNSRLPLTERDPVPYISFADILFLKQWRMPIFVKPSIVLNSLDAETH